MCMFGGGGGAPQVVYRDNPAPVVSPPATLPPPMNSDPVGPASASDSTKSNMGTSVFKITKNGYVPSNDYTDQGIDNGVQYLG